MSNLNLDKILRAALNVGASDVHLKVSRTPVFRIEGKLVQLKDVPEVSEQDLENVANQIMNDWQKQEFEKNLEMDLAYDIPGLSRFRINIFRQRNSTSMAIRAVPHEIKSFADLNLPDVLNKIANEERGLVVVTGTTGSGKSTTLASIIDLINSTKSRHIITIEDPIEYMQSDKKSYINQREIGIDARSFSRAIRASMREDPDIILVGEMRDLETMETCLAAAETGHLVLTTLHTLDAQETINRMLTVFPAHQHNQVRFQLAQVLKAILSQRLIPKSDGHGRVPAVEVLIATSRIKDLISDPVRTKEITVAIQEGNLHYGMQTFDQCLFELYNNKLITYEETMRQATNKDDLALRIQGVTSGSVSLDQYDVTSN
ncbi:MAG: PilT/PilU family type 4a pilus ATPase [Candidatus Dadabacteria bacterium]|nr:PilT/PilU family type 4a pilus ATPase [Candidatus Dadabacteria bacterium]NIQ14234.1 PilT/PilU family type 4a pilus ATPase [Candidatus Dadabacteria bacterium]